MDYDALIATAARRFSALRFGDPVTHVYNPTVYAKAPMLEYLRRYGHDPGRVLMVGMNPGPWGMAQTGIPFGAVSLVRDWMGIVAPVGRPRREHPKRPVQGFDCPRQEVSGDRLWGWARDTFVTPKRFFSRFFVWNYCPLLFMEATGRNRTPDKLPVSERKRLFVVCDRWLREFVGYLRPRYVLGVGTFAETRAREALSDAPVAIGRILHPSPASPLANRDWAGTVRRQLVELGIDLSTRRR